MPGYLMYKITQKPAALTNFRVGRNGHLPIAIVNHRMVGYLTGTDRHFATSGVEVSTHFGIGTRYAGGPVEISQYVDLADTAYGNGNYSASGGWSLVRRTSTGAVINPNFYTVSIEHQDGGTVEAGVVRPEIKAASLWLSHILLTGDVELFKLVGIRCADPAVAAALGNINPSAETYIDHNRISGTLKPYCWRPWMDDEGFLPFKAQALPKLQDFDMTFDELHSLLKARYDSDVANLTRERDEARVAANTAQTNLNNANAKIAGARDSAVALRDAADRLVQDLA